MDNEFIQQFNENRDDINKGTQIIYKYYNDIPKTVLKYLLEIDNRECVNRAIEHLLTNVKINIKNYIDIYNEEFTFNQINRLLFIGKDLTLIDKLYLYTQVKSNQIMYDINDNMFEYQNIYNLNDYLDGSAFEFKPLNILIKEPNYHGTELYNTDFLKKVKQIRREVFGEIEDKIDITMIPIAYKDYGLFWKPV